MSDTNKAIRNTEDTPKRTHKKDRAKEIANTFEWLITAFILAFVFRAFVMEAFRIPTGSMADTLHGAHFRLRCPQCNFKHHRGFTPQRYRMPADMVPSFKVSLYATKCPSCGWVEQNQSHRPVKHTVENGDRILVLKCQYQFSDPRRYDVIVFKNPLNPTENYIKRLIGLPGDKIEIVDGDVFINDHIARKPAMVQKEHWMPVYNNDYQPLDSEAKRYNGHAWVNPFTYQSTPWQIKDHDPTRFHLDTVAADQDSLLTYDAPSANDFRVTYAYNHALSYQKMPTCSDIKVEGNIQSHSQAGRFGARLSKFGVAYKGWIDFEGKMVISSKGLEGDLTVLAQKEISIGDPGSIKSLKFANVDRTLVLEYGTHTLTHDLGAALKDIEYNREYGPEVAFFGAGQMTLAHLAVFRDTYYTARSGSARKARAVEGRPFQLNEDEFFVLGDNSPNSEDGRWWSEPDMVTRGQTSPRAGVVPREYLVGKAMFVYWPSGYRVPWPSKLTSMIQKGSENNRLLRIANVILNLKWIPNIGQMRYIYGGSSETGAPGSQNTKTL
ncbi:MAG: signal peptidase I [Planctomycetes bacterium]|nr:signal peptidase I [Planctomycetota bacterium]